MKQELYINGEVVGYSLSTQNIEDVLGEGWIYRAVTLDEVLEIMYRGLLRTGGLSWEEFRHLYKTGVVFTSRRRGQYSLWQVHGLVMKRVREVNWRKRLKKV
ncbi:MAG: hypothetical protein J6T94_02815 [Bacteroidaceae bacterium]|nr:hypothetical protein [Bacteroidaceae bacterium]